MFILQIYMSNFPLKQLLCQKTTLNNFELEKPGTCYEVVPPEAVLLCSWFPTTLNNML